MTSRREYMREYRARRAAGWTKPPPLTAAEKTLRDSLRRRGLTADEHAAMLAEQGGVCAICKDPPPADADPTQYLTRLDIDHCHESDRVRGLLCRRCNLGLGMFRDNPALLLAAVAYLEAATVRA